MKSLQYDIVQTTGSLGSLLYTTYTDHFSSVANQIEKPLPNGGKDSRKTLFYTFTMKSILV